MRRVHTRHNSFTFLSPPISPRLFLNKNNNNWIFTIKCEACKGGRWQIGKSLDAYEEKAQERFNEFREKNYLSHISTIIFHAGINYIKLVICEFIFMKILMRFSHNMTHSHAMTGNRILFHQQHPPNHIIIILFLQFFEWYSFKSYYPISSSNMNLCVYDILQNFSICINLYCLAMSEILVIIIF